MLRTHRPRPLAGLPPFQGGIAGYIGYDWGAELEQVTRPPADRLTPNLPDVALALYDWVIAWDHLEEKAWLIAIGSEERATARTAWVRERLAAPPPAIRDHPASAAAPPQSNFARAEFEAGVSRIREYIAAGDVYQVNLSQRLHAPFAGSALAPRSRPPAVPSRRR